MRIPEGDKGVARGTCLRGKAMANLTKAECKILADFIEVNIYNDIRSDTNIDNMQWLVYMVEVYQKLCEEVKEKEEAKKP